MTQCLYCGIDFLLLPDKPNVKCGKCTLRVPGLSVPEIASLNVRLCRSLYLGDKMLKMSQNRTNHSVPDAVFPPMLSSILFAIGALRHTVNTFFSLNHNNILLFPAEKEAHIPRSILNLQGVAALLLEQDSTGMDVNLGLTDKAATVIASAQGFQAKASDPRLTNKPSTARGADGGLNKFKNLPGKNLGKANQVNAERKAARDEVNLHGVGNNIKVSATLWSMEEGVGKMSQVSTSS